MEGSGERSPELASGRQVGGSASDGDGGTPTPEKKKASTLLCYKLVLSLLIPRETHIIKFHSNEEPYFVCK
jgi:hypothetical protein